MSEVRGHLHITTNHKHTRTHCYAFTQLLQTYVHSCVSPPPTLHLAPYPTGSAHLVTLRTFGGDSERQRKE